MRRRGTGPDVTARDRLQRGMAVLETLDYCRQITGDPQLGSPVERCVLDKELMDTAVCTAIDTIDEQIRTILRR